MLDFSPTTTTAAAAGFVDFATIPFFNRTKKNKIGKETLYVHGTKNLRRGPIVDWFIESIETIALLECVESTSGSNRRALCVSLCVSVSFVALDTCSCRLNPAHA